jgi:hypothetical protein
MKKTLELMGQIKYGDGAYFGPSNCEHSEIWGTEIKQPTELGEIWREQFPLSGVNFLHYFVLTNCIITTSNTRGLRRGDVLSILFRG